MSEESRVSSRDPSRVDALPPGMFRAVAWIGPMLMLLGTAVGSGEILAEPAAGARYGGALLWIIVLIVITKAFWNEMIGRVAIVTGQSFLEACSGAGRAVAWVPWAWYAVNVVKDFFLRGGIVAIAGQICYDIFRSLALSDATPTSAAEGGAHEDLQVIAWTAVNYGAVWVLLVTGGYRVAEKINMFLCLILTLCLMVCALAVLPGASAELARGLVPSLPSGTDELLMILSLSGIVMSGTTTIFYSAWAEERRMGLFAFARRTGRRLSRDELEPLSAEETRRMRLWLQVNRVNVTLTYVLGALICLSTFVLGVAVLRPKGVTLSGAALAPQLSLMMTEVAGPWAKGVFYAGAWAALSSTTIGILDGGSRMYVQPLRKLAPRVFARLSVAAWQRIIMSLMAAGSLLVYVLRRDALELVVWMGVIDAPLLGVLIMAYAYLGRRYLPRAYRSGRCLAIALVLIGSLYLALGAYWGFERGKRIIRSATPRIELRAEGLAGRQGVEGGLRRLLAERGSVSGRPGTPCCRAHPRSDRVHTR